MPGGISKQKGNIMIKTFKQLVKAIAEIKTEEDRLIVYGDIDNSFQHGKITWNDHQILYTLAFRVIIINK